MTGTIEGLAVLLFVGANIAIGSIALGNITTLAAGPTLSAISACGSDLNPINCLENHEIIMISRHNFTFTDNLQATDTSIASTARVGVGVSLPLAQPTGGNR